MPYGIPPAWWPALTVASPVLIPALAVANRRFQRDSTRAAQHNHLRLNSADALDLPELEWLEVTPLVEWEAAAGFLADPAISYLIRTDRGALLFDLGFGAESSALEHNARLLEVQPEPLEALAVSCLHPAHMGGRAAARSGHVTAPRALTPPGLRPCFVPDVTLAPGFTAVWVEGPRRLAAGLGSTGPLGCALFFGGLREEQALLARLKGRGLAVLAGCGFAGLQLILEVSRRLCPGDPLYAIVGGLNFPISESRRCVGGFPTQMLLDTGKPPWRPITNGELSRALEYLDQARPARALLSAHNNCDHALARFEMELDAEISILTAGVTYRL
jgi:7,8-dihydropterin-6-yl-methyl-4-(beta-D-ribofuranosyl)aminobenzene 5'-phosphate synthase